MYRRHFIDSYRIQSHHNVHKPQQYRETIKPRSKILGSLNLPTEVQTRNVFFLNLCWKKQNLSIQQWDLGIRSQTGAGNQCFHLCVPNIYWYCGIPAVWSSSCFWEVNGLGEALISFFGGDSDLINNSVNKLTSGMF